MSRVVRRIWSTLVQEGHVERGCTYAAAFAGVDLAAAALELEVGGDFRYRHATESKPERRRALVRAWRHRGLSEANVGTDATSDWATGGRGVDVWVCTPPCQQYSGLNRERTAGEKAATELTMSRALEYVRKGRPRVVVVENVATREACAAITLNLPPSGGIGGAQRYWTRAHTRASRYGGPAGTG